MAIASESDLQNFHNKVDEVSRLIEGIRDNRLPMDYVDKRIDEVL